MALYRQAADFPVLAKDALEAWSKLPSSVVTDVMNRSQAMAGAIKPIAPGLKACGQARTLAAMVGDNSGVHALVAIARAGEILVIDAGANEDVAMWGEILTAVARARGVGGAVIDGATRDAAALRAIGFPMFCRAVVPRGPHKGFGGTIDCPISAGEVPVAPGDLVIGDDDGVVVVPLAQADRVLDAARAAADKERTVARRDRRRPDHGRTDGPP